ncbi:Maff2 family protein, partial [Dysosmobacter welbionis]
LYHRPAAGPEAHRGVRPPAGTRK